MKRNILLTIAILSFLTGAFGQKKAEAVKTCKVSAYIADADPNGLNVRATPDKNGAILKRLVRGGGDISLDIIGSAGTGWVKITNAWHGDTDEEFKGSGWVFASLLATGTRGYPNYDSPAKLILSPTKRAKYRQPCQRKPKRRFSIAPDAGSRFLIREKSAGWRRKINAEVLLRPVVDKEKDHEENYAIINARLFAVLVFSGAAIAQKGSTNEKRIRFAARKTSATVRG
jgi:hypothetical protein